MSDNKNSNLEHTQEVYPEGSYFSKFDKDRAVLIAKNWLSSVSPEDINDIEQYISALFDLWKYDFGMPPFAWLLAKTRENISEEERLERIEKLEAWETAPLWNRTPLDLFKRIWVSNYKEFLDGQKYFDGVAYLIILSNNRNDPNLWSTMVVNALMLAEYQYERDQKIIERSIGKSKIATT